MHLGAEHALGHVCEEIAVTAHFQRVPTQSGFFMAFDQSSIQIRQGEAGGRLPSATFGEDLQRLRRIAHADGHEIAVQVKKDLTNEVHQQSPEEGEQQKYFEAATFTGHEGVPAWSTPHSDQARCHSHDFED